MLSFIKVPPTTYVLHYQNGKIRHEGAGLSLFLLGAHFHNYRGSPGQRGCTIRVPGNHVRFPVRCHPRTADLSGGGP
jgi:hypothetical protein